MNLELLKSMPLKGKIALGASIVGVVLVTLLLLRLSSQPSFTPVAQGLDPAQTPKVTAALDAKGIPNQLTNGGTGVEVEESQAAPARVALAEAGVGGTGPQQPGFELLDKQQLGASDFQQKVAYQRALEGQIAQTLGGMSGVQGATVNLSLPEEQLFADEQKPTTAAVMLRGDATGLEPGAVKGIASLVASSVEGLKAEQVTITDQGGRMLWPQGDGAGGGTGATGKAAAEARYDAALQSRLDGLLTATLGPGKGQVRVRSTLNMDQQSVEQLRYDRRGTPLKTVTEEEELESQGGAGAAGGAAGSAGNIPAYARGGANGGGGESNYNKRTESTDNAVGKTVTRTKVAPGEVERLDVSLVVDQAVPQPVFNQLRRAVTAAAGIDAERGDAMQAVQVPFAKPVEPAAPATTPLGPISNVAKWAALGLAALLFLFFVTRHLRRREQDAIMDEPRWLSEVDQPLLGPGGPGGAGAAAVSSEPTALLTQGANVRREQVEQVVEQDPERVAATLRAWISEGEAV